MKTDELAAALADLATAHALLRQMRPFVVLIAQEDASMPPELPDDAVAYIELTAREVRAARSVLAAGDEHG